MSTTTKTIILKAKIAGVLQEVFVNTGIDNVLLTEDGTQKTLSAKLAEILSAIEGKANAAEIKAEVTTELQKLVGAAPEALDTLEELAAKALENADLLADLKEISTGKVDKEAGKSLIADTLVASLGALDFTALAGINATKIAAWDKGQANVIEGLTVNGVAVPLDGKTANITTNQTHVSVSEPVNMTDGDLWLQITE